jgi:hypothetical protein
MKRIILLIALSIGASIALADSSKAGVYNSQTGLLAIPFVRVLGSPATYNVELKERIQGREYTFDLYSATRNPPYNGQGTATYNGESGALVIPEVSVDGSNHTYSVTLQKRAHSLGEYVFDLETVTLNNAGGCNDSVYPYVIGCPGPAGGIIFYISQDGSSGMEAALKNAGTAPWGCDETLVGGTKQGMSTGQSNTDAIIANCGENSAAYLAANYKWPNGQTDGVLPSRFELDELYKHRDVVGGFAGVYSGPRF